MKLNWLPIFAVALTAAAPALAQSGGAASAAKQVEAQTTPKAPPQTTPAATGAGAQAPAGTARVAASGDIVETAKAAGQFNTFLKAAEATNLTNLLKTQKNITVFAPTDAAFAALPAGELEKLMLPENKAELQKLVIYHLVNAPVTTADFKGATRKAATVAGPSVELQGGDSLMVNDAHIVQADISASNGVLHVVDKVLMPSTATAASATGAAASATAPAGTPAAPAAQPPATLKRN